MGESVHLLFPGQGAQVVGMARDAYDAGGAAAALYRDASDILGFDLATLSFDGPREALDRTENCQPALLVASLALLAAWREKQSVDVVGAAGLSLGEYTALVALDGMDFADAVRLVRRRGELMEAAAAERPGTMASVLGLDADVVESCCREAVASGAGEVVAANFNCPGQIVISGEHAAVDAASARLKEAGARRVLPLAVSGAFHSPLMASAREGLEAALAETPLRPPRGAFVNNADAMSLSEPEAIRDSLARQLTSPVRWEASCRAMVASGTTVFHEVGPGKTCQGLMKRTAPEATVISISSLADMDAAR